MDPKERELRQRLAAKLQEARTFTDEGKLEEARTATDEAKSLRKQVDLMEEQRGLDGTPAPGSFVPAVAGTPEERSQEEEAAIYRSAFLKAFRNKQLSHEERELLENHRIEERSMSGGVAEDGGLIIPPDIQTMVHELKRQLVSLESYVTVEPVTSRSGSRVIEKNADITPFTTITETTDLSDLDNPKFRQISYAIVDRGGILPVSNSLLADTDQNLMKYIAKWIAKKSTVTRNKLILDLVATLTKKAIATIDDLKKVLNVDLDPNIEIGSIIIVNQDTFNYLDTLKDSDNRYLLQPDPTQPNRKLLFGKTVVVLANRWLPTTGTTTKKAPIIIGDLKEAIALFDRQQYSIATTNVGGKAFARNTTDVRVIEREDVKLFDNEAIVYGEITLA